jgi:hypothetical protein
MKRREPHIIYMSTPTTHHGLTHDCSLLLWGWWRSTDCHDDSKSMYFK